jgi:hypothetical protein
MEYREIVSVTGLGGLFQLLATKSDGAIVRNLADGSTKFISARLHNVTPLESIEVYTTGENVRLHEVLQRIQQQEGSLTAPDPKKASNAEIKQYFGSVLPEFDEDRVYVSDMKKIIKWYDLLKANDLLHFESMEAAEGVAEGNEEAVTEAVNEETAAAEASMPKIDAMAEAAEGGAEDEKPAKKARAKKAAEPAEGGEKTKKTATRKKKEEKEEGEANSLF